MGDHEQDPFKSVLSSSDKTLFAVATIVVAASSAYVWQRTQSSASGFLQVIGSSSRAKENDVLSASTPTSEAAGSHIRISAENPDPNDPKPRSKERRKRGKDPLKEILKKSGGKLASVKVPRREPDATTSTAVQSKRATSRDTESSRKSRGSRDSSQATSSRSNSLASRDLQQAPPLRNHNSSDLTITATEEGSLDTVNQSTADSLYPSHYDGPSSLDKPQIVEPMLLTESSSHSSSASSSGSGASGLTANTSPASSLFLSPEQVSTNVALPPSKSTPASLPKNGSNDDAWDWDLPINSKPGDTSAYRKSPRLNSNNSKSRVSTSKSPIPTSVSHTLYTTPNFPSVPSGRESPVSSISGPSRSSSVESIPFNFPTLNPPMNDNDTGANGHANNTPRRAPRAQTPSSQASTPPPSLSAQTQIASLRGALEAARKREEASRRDMDRLAKDFDMLRWELSLGRKREADLQANIHHLAHQLQAYASVMVGMPPTRQQRSASHSHLQVPNAHQGYRIPSPVPSLNSPNGHVHNANGHNNHSQMLSPPAGLSPMHSPGLPSPFFVYPPAPMSLPGSAGIIPPPNLFSMLLPASSSTSSSVGSMSPDMADSPTPLNRGRTRARTASGALTADQPEWVGDQDEQSPHSTTTPNGRDDIDEEDGEELNGLLADAILKRPESMRNMKSKAKEREREASSETVFTFPSISDLGLVDPRVYGRNMDLGPERREDEQQSQSQQEEYGSLLCSSSSMDAYIPPSTSAPLTGSSSEGSTNWS